MSDQDIRPDTGWMEQAELAWQAASGEALSRRGAFHVLLGVDEPLLQLYRERLAKLKDWPWSSTTLFLAQENWVRAEEDSASYQKVYRSFYPHKIHIERWKTEAALQSDAAADYERRLKARLSSPPRFDLAILSLREDGSLAGLYSDTSAWNVAERLTAWNHVPQKNAHWLTVTFPLLAQARQILLFSETNRSWENFQKTATQWNFLEKVQNFVIKKL